MIPETIFDITLRDNKTGDYLKVPVLPPAVSYQGGDSIATTVNIVNLGAVDFPNGIDLEAVNWYSFFPTRYDIGYVNVTQDELLLPNKYIDQFNVWKREGTQLQLIIPALLINQPMRVASFTWDAKGAEVDIYYQVSLKKVINLRPVQISTSTTLLSKKKSPASRTAVPKKKPTSYTVKAGDTLILIAKRLGIASWHTIYDKNKKQIGPDPEGIYPGLVLKL
jgi:nucleoid-associated protein YgaU